MTENIVKIMRRMRASLQDSEHVHMVLLALLIGVGGGFAAVGFRELISLGNWVAWGNSSYTLKYIQALPFWWKILVPAVGGMLCALIVYYFAREAKGHGVPEVMEAVALRGGRIRPRVVLAKMFASAISIASGGSVGREGPIVQIGSAFGSTIGQWLGLDERRLRTLVGCGAAAGIAATFNAPVAGALFAVEIILADFRVMQFSPIVISSVMATVIGHWYFSDVPAFVVQKYSVVSHLELIAYGVLGILAGLLALAFVRILYFTEDLFDAVKIWPPLKAIAGGAIIGAIALQFPEVYGVGYEAIGLALDGQVVWYLLILLAVIKIVAVAITIGSGGSGGIFAPSLFIGAMAGGAVGVLVNKFWPGVTAPPGAYALVGMAAVVGAATHAPITAIVIIFELTNDYKLILPLMISTILATLLATKLQHGSIYTIKLLRRGVDIHKGQDVSLLKHLRVRDEMRDDTVTIAPDAGLLEVIQKLMAHPGFSIFVVDEERCLRGVITANQCRTFLVDLPAFGAFIIARDLMQEAGFPTIGPDATLADVMRRLTRYRGEVPVVESGRLVGAIWPEDVIARYNSELFKRDMAASMVSTVSEGPHAEPLPTVQNTVIAEVGVPSHFVGRSVASLDIRSRYDVTVLLIRKRSETGEEVIKSVAGADYVFQSGDVMLVMGSEDRLHALQRGQP